MIKNHGNGNSNVFMTCETSLFNTLNDIIGLYDNKDKQDKQNMSYWKEIIILCYS
jgi:hypothetical protein